ncbi:22K [Mastadenovirus eidoli]|uniref:22K n=1 Tax=Eidolon helvum adenovirus TaxID=2039267 RepID=A0A348FKH3_9ADEN|nr:22K [Eidolon helvum adenovirus]BBF72840.1 22K [Eidolon helvum adenovirus]
MQKTTEGMEVEAISSAEENSRSSISSLETSYPQEAPSKNNRWDMAPGGKKKYKSWRGHKNTILACLHETNCDVGFTRRYMLMHHGTAIPKNIIYYYASCYRKIQKTSE